MAIRVSTEPTVMQMLVMDMGVVSPAAGNLAGAT